MTPEFPVNTIVKFNDGSDDHGAVIKVDIDAVGRYYLVKRTYNNPLRTYTHWYGENELRKAYET
jgi:hypothetical protein